MPSSKGQRATVGELSPALAELAKALREGRVKTIMEPFWRPEQLTEDHRDALARFKERMKAR